MKHVSENLAIEQKLDNTRNGMLTRNEMTILSKKVIEFVSALTVKYKTVSERVKIYIQKRFSEPHREKNFSGIINKRFSIDTEQTEWLNTASKIDV